MAAEPVSFWPASLLWGISPQTFAVPPAPQDWFAGQVPQLSTSEQPSLMPPQFLPSAEQVVGVQVEPLPQTLAVPPPPQLSGLVQLPQLSLPPQPSGMDPQFLL